MATIEDLLQKSISDMTKEELIDHLKDIRLSRRTPAKKTKVKKVKKEKDLTKDMTEQQMEELLRQLEEKL